MKLEKAEVEAEYDPQAAERRRARRVARSPRRRGGRRYGCAARPAVRGTATPPQTARAPPPSAAADASGPRCARRAEARRIEPAAFLRHRRHARIRRSPASPAADNRLGRGAPPPRGITRRWRRRTLVRGVGRDDAEREDQRTAAQYLAPKTAAGRGATRVAGLDARASPARRGPIPMKDPLPSAMVSDAAPSAALAANGARYFPAVCWRALLEGGSGAHQRERSSAYRAHRAAPQGRPRSVRSDDQLSTRCLQPCRCCTARACWKPHRFSLPPARQNAQRHPARYWLDHASPVPAAADRAQMIANFFRRLDVRRCARSGGLGPEAQGARAAAGDARE